MLPFQWGRGEHGQLGLDPRDTSFRPLPQEVKKMKGMTILAAACSENHSVVVATMPGSGPKGDVKVFSWGRGVILKFQDSGKVPAMKETIQDNPGEARSEGTAVEEKHLATDNFHGLLGSIQESLMEIFNR
eukprot:766480-Hanusia_phi.AAC.7